MLSFVDLFCGCGGASVGLIRAGMRHVAAYDIDHDALASYLLLAGHQATECDIADVDVASVVQGADVVWVSAPCQEISRARGKVEKDSDGIRLFVSVMRQLVPLDCWIVVENSQNLATFQQMDDIYDLIMRHRRMYFGNGTIQKYVLDCSKYGVPQKRVRLFWAIPPTGCLPLSFRDPKVEKSSFKALQATHDPDPERMTLTVGERINAQFLPKNSWEDLPKTVLASHRAWLKDGRYMHPEEDRRLTVGENMILQCLPLKKICGNLRSRYRQVGNAVPPPMAEMIGRKIIEATKGKSMKTGREAKNMMSKLQGDVTLYEPGENCATFVSIRQPDTYVAIIKPKNAKVANKVPDALKAAALARLQPTAAKPTAREQFENALAQAASARRPEIVHRRESDLRQVGNPFFSRQGRKRQQSYSRGETAICTFYHMNGTLVKKDVLKKLSKAFDRTTGSISCKNSNLKAHDPKSPAKGATHGSKLDKEFVKMYLKDRPKFRRELNKGLSEYRITL